MREGLGLEQFYVLGHSWEDILAVKYALKYRKRLPEGIVISNMSAGIDSYLRHVSKIRSGFPKEVRNELDRYEKAGTTEELTYQKLLFEKLYIRFSSPVGSRPIHGATIPRRYLNQKVYNAMQEPE